MSMRWYQVTLKTNRQQRNAERHGFRLCGILPAIDRDSISPGVIRRVYEGIDVNVLAPPSDVHLPRWADLEEPARRLWQAVFGEHPVNR